MTERAEHARLAEAPAAESPWRLWGPYLAARQWWMRVLYRYPQASFPYHKLWAMAAEARRDEREPELPDTGVLAENRFFDVRVSYAKAAPDDICVEITATNHGPDVAPLHLLPQLWFRNTGSWGRDARRPALIASTVDDWARVIAEHSRLGRYTLQASGTPTLLPGRAAAHRLG